jgi:hypothetical protein
MERCPITKTSNHSTFSSINEPGRNTIPSSILSSPFSQRVRNGSNRGSVGSRAQGNSIHGGSQSKERRSNGGRSNSGKSVKQNDSSNSQKLKHVAKGISRAGTGMSTLGIS